MTKCSKGTVVLMGVWGALFIGCGTKPLNRTESPVRINEIASANTSFQDESGGCDDWIELYNLGDTDVDLGGYFLSDDVDERFAKAGGTASLALAPGVILPASGVLLVWADNEPVQSTSTSPHLSFSLSAAGEGVWLSNPSGYVVDSVEFEAVSSVISGTPSPTYARFADGTGNFNWCSVPTPRTLNGAKCAAESL